MEPNPPLAQKCLGEIAVVGHHDFDSGFRNTVLVYTHCADRKSYLCRSSQKREHLIENLNSCPCRPTAQLSRNEIMKYKPSTPFEIDRKLYPKKNIFLFVVPLEVLICSRTTASLKICLCRQVFVRVETSRSHLVWSAVERNLTFFWLSKQPCPNFVSSATRALYPGVVNQWFPID